ncbi:palmitoyltransferase ZDHHC17-like [Iris pallida]|uniref:S-acyltransferase n=1 Tax=Iris pallida TaxID=29817 RepID=A0AAX6GV51_IRIPA|nr:palmitoyltransferase ZDHHC17-like [Iris pallida]
MALFLHHLKTMAFLKSIFNMRYCKICKTGVRGFNHHCSAFGNCIGQKNHRLFMVLLIGFVIVEASYTLSYTSIYIKIHEYRKSTPGGSPFSEVTRDFLQLEEYRPVD